MRLRTSMGSSPTATAMLAWWGEKASASILGRERELVLQEAGRIPEAQGTPVAAAGEDFAIRRKLDDAGPLVVQIERALERGGGDIPEANFVVTTRRSEQFAGRRYGGKANGDGGGALRLAFAQNRLPVLGARRRDGWIHVSSYCVRRMACLRSSAVICFHTISAFCRRGPFSGSTRRASAK